MKKAALPLLAVFVVTVSSVIGGFRTRPASTTAAELTTQEQLKQDFGEALELVKENYAGEAEFEMLGEHSIQAMLNQLDPHSSFFSKDRFDALQTEQRSRFYGIGVTIQRVYNRVHILSVNEGGPADRAGLKYGDAVVAVDSRNTEDWNTNQVMDQVRGEKGEPVAITVQRPGVLQPITVSIRRDEVKLPSVRNAFMISGTTTGYIGLTGGFSKRTVEELTAAVGRLKSEGMRQLIMDLRGNPGGLLDEAVRVAEKFLPPGLKIVEVRGRDSLAKGRTYEASDENEPELMPMVILIDGRTASASEVVSGALQDHERALIVGETSFGKGLVQTVYPLWGGTGLTLTTAKYYTPSGRSIQRDYSKVSFYDYSLNRHENNGSRGDAFRTDLGREVYGGGGITPDLEVKPPVGSATRTRLYYGVFDFVRHLVNGQIPGFREYRIAECQNKQRLTSDDLDRYPVTDKLLAAFRQRLSEQSDLNVTDERFNANLDYIHHRLRTEIATAAYGPEAGHQVFLTDDIQLRKAIEKLPEARQLAENVSRVRGDRQ